MSTLIKGMMSVDNGSDVITILDNTLDAKTVTPGCVLFNGASVLPLPLKSGSKGQVVLEEPWPFASIPVGSETEFIILYLPEGIRDAIAKIYAVIEQLDLTEGNRNAWTLLLTSTDPTVTIEINGQPVEYVPYGYLLQQLNNAIATVSATKFKDLSDVPDYSSHGGKMVVINSDGSGVTFLEIPDAIVVNGGGDGGGGSALDISYDNSAGNTQFDNVQGALSEALSKIKVLESSSGGGGTGSGPGLPMNTALPLYVGGVDEYTAPDGTIWLKTGYQSTDVGRFPDATVTGGFIGSPDAKTDPVSGFPVYVRCK